MRKRTLFLFILLFAFWIVISSNPDLQHILIGAFLAFITAWFWHVLGPRQPVVLSFRALLILFRCLLMLGGYVIGANIAVAKTMLFSNPPAKPVFVVMKPGINSDWGRVLLATCITITPGTITVDVNPDTGEFFIHALTERTAIDLASWRMISEIKKLENQMKKEAEHVSHTDRSDDIGSVSAAKGNNRINAD
ncbi:MAG: Na+/H+ antiporter subunit E [Firmicutes bacterium]|nr:Na+/H+ antiporter subunit E [Bacillota bacterium]